MASEDLSSTLRDRRRHLGLTQAEVAGRAGVSRQLVAAVEAGRNAPAVDAALRLARALETTVEALFGPPRVRRAEPAVGTALEPGVPLRVGRVGDRLVAAPLGDHGTAGAGWAAPDAVIVGDTLELLPGTDPEGFVLAGCDPALGVAETMLRGLGAARLVVFAAPTGRAVQALANGSVHAAVVHGPHDRLPAPPVPVTRLHLAAWQVGLAVPAGHPDTSLEAALRHDGAVVGRERSAASQQALERAARALDIVVASGPEASGHIDAARLGDILGCPAVTTEAAARAFGLRFLPVETHTVEVWIATAWSGHAGVEALGGLLGTRAFGARLATFGGYDLTDCGRYVPAD